MTECINTVTKQYYHGYIIQHKVWCVGHTLNLSIAFRNQTTKFTYEIPHTIDDTDTNRFCIDFRHRVDTDIWGMIAYLRMNNKLTENGGFSKSDKITK